LRLRGIKFRSLFVENSLQGKDLVFELCSVAC